jgi:hypothetical protein
VTKELSDAHIIGLFKQHLKFVRERHDCILAQNNGKQAMIEQSRALIVQIDEQINRIEGELAWLKAD